MGVSTERNSLIKTKEIALRRKIVILVEDNRLFRETWEKLASDMDVVTFANPEDMIKAYKDNEELFRKASAIVLDNDFGPESSMSGFALAELLKGAGFKTPLFLSSGGDFNVTELKKLFTNQIPKNPSEGIQLLSSLI